MQALLVLLVKVVAFSPEISPAIWRTGSPRRCRMVTTPVSTFALDVLNSVDHSPASEICESIGDQALAWVDELWSILDKIAGPTAFYVCPDLQLGSQLTDPPKLDYVRAYWSSPTHDFVPFLIGVKNKYDPDDVFRFARSIPLSLADPDAAAAFSE
jgi:hypothetical protein